MTNFNEPTNTTVYSSVLQNLRDRDVSIGKMDFASDTNIPTGFLRYNRSNRKFEEWNGSTWASTDFQIDLDAHISNTLIHQALPPGVYLPFGGTTAPSGFLMCDGGAYSRTTYAGLFAVIGVSFGAGDGSTTFNVPSMGGRFPLGKTNSGTGSVIGETGGSLDHTHTVPGHHHSHNTGVGSNIAISASGSQSVSISHGHAHTLSTGASGGHGHSITDPGHDHTLTSRADGSGNTSSNAFVSSYVQAGAGNRTNTAIDPTGTGISVNSVGDHTHAVNGSVTNYTGNITVPDHTHSSAQFTGSIGNVNSGLNGNSNLTSGASNPPYTAANYIIKY